MKKYSIFSFVVIGAAFLVFSPAVNAESASFARDLRLGASGQDVIQLQEWLIEHEYDIPSISAGRAVKGWFGPQTQAALQRYQHTIGLPAYGFFGPLTRERINSGKSAVHVPVISSVDGPSLLGVGQTGIWQVQANDPDGRVLRYAVTWGDETLFEKGFHAALPALFLEFVTSARFTHPYASTGTYTAKFIAKNDLGFTATKEVIITVATSSVSTTTPTTTPPTVPPTVPPPSGTLRVLSPNGGESLQKGIFQTITWFSPQYYRAAYADIYLIPYTGPCTGTGCDANRYRYAIVKGVPMQANSFNWEVNYVETSDDAMSRIVPDGSYLIELCEQGAHTCDTSDAPFTISGSGTTNPNQ